MYKSEFLQGSAAAEMDAYVPQVRIMVTARLDMFCADQSVEHLLAEFLPMFEDALLRPWLENGVENFGEVENPEPQGPNYVLLAQ